MATNLIPLPSIPPNSNDALAQLLAEALAQGRVTVVIGDLGDRAPSDGAFHGDSSQVAAAATLAREGDIWTFTIGQRRVRVVDGKGVQYLATLLQHPSVEMSALDLAGGFGMGAGSHDHAGPLLDATAKRAYKTRLDDLRDELERAEVCNDHARISCLKEELDFLGRELASAIGLSGRTRVACSNAERARVNVTRAIHSLIKRVAAHDPVIGRELRTTIRTGTFCTYEPDPFASPAWRVERG